MTSNDVVAIVNIVAGVVVIFIAFKAFKGDV